MAIIWGKKNNKKNRSVVALMIERWKAVEIKVCMVFLLSICVSFMSKKQRMVGLSVCMLTSAKVLDVIFSCISV